MDEREIIAHLQQFFLGHDNRAQRHQFAGSLSKELNDLLLEFERHFIHEGIDSDVVNSLLSKYQLVSFKKEIKEIQTNFYLHVNELAGNNQNTSDHQELINAQNPSYAFLTDDTGFERELEIILKKRTEINEKVKEFEKQRVAAEEAAKDPGDNIRPIQARKRNLYKYISIAACLLVLVYFIWQPFNKSDRELFNTYITTQKPLPFSKQGEPNNEVRGNIEDAFVGLSEVEKDRASEAYALYQKRSYNVAAQALENIGISPSKGNQLLIILAISQLHIGDLENAGANLQAVLQQKDTTQHDDARFYLSLYYLKTHKRINARNLLKELTGKPGRYESESKTLIKTMRWF
jgi:hypothetical protein